MKNVGLNPDGTLTGCQVGLAVYAESGNGGATNLTVSNTSVHDYDKNGITGVEPGTTLAVRNSTITGAGATTVTAQNGIELGYGARGSITGNTVGGNNYASCTIASCSYTASNIIVYQAADYATVSSNILSDSNTNIAFYGNHGTLKYNSISKDIAYDGIDLVGSYNTADNNSITRSDNSAVYICGSHNAVHYNNINEAIYGVYEDQSGSCSASGANSATSNTMNNVQFEVTPNDGTVPEAHTFAQQLHRNAKASVARR